MDKQETPYKVLEILPNVAGVYGTIYLIPKVAFHWIDLEKFKHLVLAQTCLDLGRRASSESVPDNCFRVIPIVKYQCSFLPKNNSNYKGNSQYIIKLAHYPLVYLFTSDNPNILSN